MLGGGLLFCCVIHLHNKEVLISFLVTHTSFGQLGQVDDILKFWNMVIDHLEPENIAFTTVKYCVVSDVLLPPCGG